jgi:phosphate starvation-inducible protein PhoH and related proteins
MERTVALRDLDEERFLFGHLDRNLHVLRNVLGVEATSRRGQLKLKGSPTAIEHAARTVEHALSLIRDGRVSEPGAVERLFRAASRGEHQNGHGDEPPPAPHSGGEGAKDKVHVAARGRNQQAYLDAISTSTITFAIGPAGTGKSYLAVASAVRFLKSGQYRKIVLCRPAVEAGESLGFLPGDLQAKINPYLRPLYDALNDLLPRGQLKRYIEEEIIEILPLAYMRGRTLDHAVIILDEAQNSTIGQMKMFLTRLGERSKMIVTGDVTQIDLPAYKTSGLIHAVRILDGIEGVSFIRFNKGDIVRHPVVQDILKAYTKDEEGTDPSEHESGAGDARGPAEPQAEGFVKRFRRDARFRPR